MSLLKQNRRGDISTVMLRWLHIDPSKIRSRPILFFVFFLVFQTNPVGVQLFSYVNNAISSVPINLYRCWSYEWKHSWLYPLKQKFAWYKFGVRLLSLQLIRHFSCTVNQNRFQMSVKIWGASCPISPTKCTSIEARVIASIGWVLSQYLHPCWC